MRKKKLGLIDGWRQGYKIWSVWIFALVVASPEIYSAIAAMGWLDQAPPVFVWMVRGIGAIGIAVRLTKQEKLKGDKNDCDSISS